MRHAPGVLSAGYQNSTTGLPLFTVMGPTCCARKLDSFTGRPACAARCVSHAPRERRVLQSGAEGARCRARAVLGCAVAAEQQAAAEGLRAATSAEQQQRAAGPADAKSGAAPCSVRGSCRQLLEPFAQKLRCFRAGAKSAQAAARGATAARALFRAQSRWRDARPAEALTWSFSVKSGACVARRRGVRASAARAFAAAAQPQPTQFCDGASATELAQLVRPRRPRA